MYIDLSLIQNNILGQFILPFVLFFAVAYGSLRTADVFKDRQINAIIAAVIGLMASFYEPLVSALFLYMPYMFVVLVILFAYNLISTLFKGKKPEGASTPKTEPPLDVIIILGIMLLLLNAFGADNMPDIPGIDGTNLTFLLALLAIFVIVKRGYTKEKQTSKSSGLPPDE